MNDLTRLILGSILLIAGLAASATASLLVYALLPTLLASVGALFGFSILDLTSSPVGQLLLVTAAGATSGLLVLLLALGVGRLNRVEFDAWPNLSTVWLAWLATHVLLWLIPTVFG